MSGWFSRGVFPRFVAIVCAAAPASQVKAVPITFSAWDGTRQASATFDASGADLIVTLANTSSGDVLVPADVLTALFFDVNDGPLTLTRGSAIVPGGSSVLFGGTDPGGVIGGEWAYRGGLVGPDGAAYGISAAGLGLFGSSDVFPGSNLQGPADPDGLQYGISSAGDNPATGNAAVTGLFALVKNTVEFRLSGLPTGFDPSQSISNVQWQYGTALDEPRIPEPACLLLLALAGVVGWRRR